MLGNNINMKPDNITNHTKDMTGMTYYLTLDPATICPTVGAYCVTVLYRKTY